MVKECNGNVKNVLELIFYKFTASSATHAATVTMKSNALKHNSQDIGW